MTKQPINYSKLDKYVWDKMMDLSQGMIRVSVVELFHHVKDDPEYYNILGRSINELEDRRLVRDYQYSVPILNNSLKRLQRKDLMSEAQERRKGIDF